MGQVHGPKLSPYERACRKLIQPAGMKRWQLNAEEPGPVPGYHGDRPLPHAPERPCSRCRKRFQPTLRRRMLCAPCFGKASGGDEAA